MIATALDFFLDIKLVWHCPFRNAIMGCVVYSGKMFLVVHLQINVHSCLLPHEYNILLRQLTQKVCLQRQPFLFQPHCDNFHAKFTAVLKPLGSSNIHKLQNIIKQCVKISTRSRKKSRQAICKDLIKVQTPVRKSHQVNGKNLVKLSFACVFLLFV